MSSTDEKQWYERPIEVAGIDIDSGGNWISRRSVRNGVLGGNFFPERHLWKDEAEQRADIADLQELVLDMEWERLMDIVAPLGGVGEPDGSTGA